MVDLSESLQRLLTDLIAFIPRLIVAVIVFLAALLIAGRLARMTERAARRKIDRENTVQLLAHLVRWSVIAIGTLLALDQVNFDITGFVAGLGIVGIAIGFALQDIARNFVAGLLLFIREPFQIGDAVKAGGFNGQVEEISTRDTVLRSWDGEKVIVANIDVLQNPIINYSHLERRRRTVYLGIGYGQDVQRALDVFGETVRAVPGVLSDPSPELLADQLGDSAMQVTVRFWVNPQADSIFVVHSNVVLALNEAAERAGIDLPYPIQTVRLIKPEVSTAEND